MSELANSPAYFAAKFELAERGCSIREFAHSRIR